MLRSSLAALAVLLSTPSLAAPQVQVVGLFPGAAVLLVDGQRQLVKVGQTGPGGVGVVSADSQAAVLLIEGRQQRVGLSRDFSQSGAPGQQRRQETSARDADGHYRFFGAIDGQMVQFLVDTGATSVAMNEGQARRLGIDYRAKGRPITVATASGSAQAWRVPLNRVAIGSLEVLGVEGVVVQGDSPREVLLGMSFLSRVRWAEEQGMLRLEPKF